MFKLGNRIWYAESGKAITRHQEWLVPTELFREGTSEEERHRSKGQTVALVTRNTAWKGWLEQERSTWKNAGSWIRAPRKMRRLFFNPEGVVMSYSWVIWCSRPPKTLLNLFGENVFSHLGITRDGLWVTGPGARFLWAATLWSNYYERLWKQEFYFFIIIMFWVGYVFSWFKIQQKYEKVQGEKSLPTPCLPGPHTSPTSTWTAIWNPPQAPFCFDRKIQIMF